MSDDASQSALEALVPDMVPVTVDEALNPPERSPSPANSVQTLRPRDLSRWLQCCQPFLLEIIQYRSERDILTLTQRNDERKQLILQWLVDRNRPRNEDLAFLELRPLDDIDPPKKQDRGVNVNASAFRRSFTGSQTSVNSISSQVSNSDLNDVQQSAQALVQSLRLGLAVAKACDGRRDRLVSTILQSARYDRAKLVQLQNAMHKAEQMITYYQKEMPTIGFCKLPVRECFLIS